MKQALTLRTGLIAIATVGLMTHSFYSCGSNGCEETRETFLYADMSAQGTTKITHLEVWYNDTLKSTAANPTSMELVLPPDSSHIQYRLDMTVSGQEEAFQVSDTIDINYEAFPYFLNMECGCSVYFTLKEIKATSHLLQEVTLINKDITNEESVNLRIVY